MMGGVRVNKRIEIILKSGKTIDVGYGELKIKCNKKTRKIEKMYFMDFLGRANAMLYIDPNEVAAIVGMQQE